jgi:cysteine desulfurase/selenocysteine lyase
LTSSNVQAISDNELFNIVRADFQITNKKIYLNNGSIGPLPLSTIKSITDFYLRYSEAGPDSLEFTAFLDALKKEVRQRLADLISCRNDEIIFTQSTTEGINFVANGIDWRTGDKILVRDPINEHYSNYLPWIKISNEFGLGVSNFPSSNNSMVTGKQLISEFEKSYKHNSIRMVSTSHVMYNNGSVTPIEKISNYINESSQDTLLAIDGAQSVGSIKVNVKSLRCDFLTFPGFKWICGPLGVAALFVRKQLMEEFTPIFVGSGSSEVATLPKPDVGGKTSGRRKVIRFHEYPEKYHSTFRNFPGLAGLEASLRYILRIGISNITQRNKNLYSILREGLVSDKEIIIHEADEEEFRSNMLSFSLKSNNNGRIPKMNQMLQKNGIIMAEREIGERKILRMSPHFFNSEEEMSQTISVIKSLIGKLD